ncbi:Dolichol-phosphate mannosyltransferase subunit 3 [Psidium guajava]|nr:Dolichol-phosphate mannosyltransferase subunit 3 [Psidium guajava]
MVISTSTPASIVTEGNLLVDFRRAEEPRSSTLVLSSSQSSELFLGYFVGFEPNASPIPLVFQRLRSRQIGSASRISPSSPHSEYSPSRLRLGLLEHNEAHCEDNYLIGGYLCHVDWSPGDVFVPRSHTCCQYTHCFTGMLWIADGWHRPNALSNLSSRGSVIAAGRCRGQGFPEAKRGRC